MGKLILADTTEIDNTDVVLNGVDLTIIIDDGDMVKYFQVFNDSNKTKEMKYYSDFHINTYVGFSIFRGIRLLDNGMIQIDLYGEEDKIQHEIRYSLPDVYLPDDLKEKDGKVNESE